MHTYALSIQIYEGGSLQSATGYSGKEIEALEEVILSLWSPTYSSTRSFEVMLDDDDELVLIYRDSKDGLEYPMPNEWLTKTITVGTKEVSLVGDRIPVNPRKLGLTPWIHPVHVQFFQS